jgi:uncharacterized protein (TIGR00661 family)
MKILYSIQATGNGHISRAIEIMPYLEKYGKVDVFLSGSNSNLSTPKNLNIKYRSKGLSLFYGRNGSLNYIKIFNNCSIINALKDANKLPVENYDIILNDFESITSIACKMKNIHSLGFGHQASFISDSVPRPRNKNILGELILKYYSPCTDYLGLHFENYSDDILQPIIKQKIIDSTPFDGGYITVYLPHYTDEELEAHFNKIKHLTFVIFSRKAKSFEKRKNVIIRPIENSAFSLSMINAHGIITGGGFETPAESLYLGKKLMVIPIKGQYEQECNAAALKRFNVPVVNNVNHDFSNIIETWLNAPSPYKFKLHQSTEYIVQQAIYKASNIKSYNNNKYPWDNIEISPTIV